MKRIIFILVNYFQLSFTPVSSMIFILMLQNRPIRTLYLLDRTFWLDVFQIWVQNFYSKVLWQKACFTSKTFSCSHMHLRASFLLPNCPIRTQYILNTCTVFWCLIFLNNVLLHILSSKRVNSRFTKMTPLLIELCELIGWFKRYSIIKEEK